MMRQCMRAAAVARLGSGKICRAAIATGLAASSAGCSQGILNPQGPIGAAERTILFNSLGIMLAIVIPTILTTLGVAWWYRKSNSRAAYRPTWEFSGKIEIVVWSIPAMVVLLLGGVAWVGSHDLDPAKPIAADAPTVEIRVVALDWKWLFIYPDHGVATVNRMVVPAGSPISLKITSATVMNSFFVPQLGSQIYAMAGMTSRLNLLASQPGQFPGISAQFSGDGFSGMQFVVDALPAEQFAAWVSSAKSSSEHLDTQAYRALARPSKYVPPRTYGSVDPDLFGSIVGMRIPSYGALRPYRDEADAYMCSAKAKGI